MIDQPTQSMTGAEALVSTLADHGVTACFANPGTSEMHFVAALDRVEGIRCVLGLFEGVVTGAADGFARMVDRPLTVEDGTGAGLGRQVEAAQKLRVERYDDRRQ